jgi:PEP-CTERM motif
MKTKKILPLAALIGVLMASQTALAGVILTSYSGSADFGNGPVGYRNGSVVPNPSSVSNPVGVGIGGDSFKTADTSYDFSSTGQFNAWCIDIYHWMIGAPVEYSIGTATDLAAVLNALRPNGPSGATRVDQLILLANEVFSDVDTQLESAAFQLAVWEIAFGTPVNGVYQVGTTDQGFRVDNSTATSDFGSLANTWLLKLDTAAKTGSWTLNYLNDGTSNRTQDVIVFTDPPAVVPEPAAIALLGLGLGALGFIRCRRT